MVNSNKLKAKIIERGYTISTISSEMNLSSSTFYRKMHGNSFLIREVDLIKSILNLSKDDAVDIFLLSKSCINETQVRNQKAR